MDTGDDLPGGSFKQISFDKEDAIIGLHELTYIKVNSISMKE